MFCLFPCLLVAQLCLTLCDPMDSSPPGSSDHGISQARILEWVAISFSRGSSHPRDQTWVSFIGRQMLYHLRYQGSRVCVCVCMSVCMCVCVYRIIFQNHLKVYCRHTCPLILKFVFPKSKCILLHNHNMIIRFRKESIDLTLLSTLQFEFQLHQFPIRYFIAIFPLSSISSRISISFWR